MTDDPGVHAPTDGDPGPQEFGWRNTPRINFAPERRRIRFSLWVAILALILFVEALGALTVFARLQAAQAEALNANDRLDTVQRALNQERAATDDVEAKIKSVGEEIMQIEQQSAGVIEVYNRLTQQRPEWAAALQALMQADSAEFWIYRLDANPPDKAGSPAQIGISATANGADTIGDFLSYMEDKRDFLDLASWNTALTSADTTMFEAVVDLK